jgi:hypothetical protein
MRVIPIINKPFQPITPDASTHTTTTTTIYNLHPHDRVPSGRVRFGMREINLEIQRFYEIAEIQANIIIFNISEASSPEELVLPIRILGSNN